MENKAKKSVVSFEESRTRLLNSFRARVREQIIEKEIHFSDDVPAFIKQLKEFEKRSRKTVITVK